MLTMRATVPAMSSHIKSAVSSRVSSCLSGAESSYAHWCLWYGLIFQQVAFDCDPVQISRSGCFGPGQPRPNVVTRNFEKKQRRVAQCPVNSKPAFSSYL